MDLPDRGEVTTCDPPSMHLWISPDVGDLCWCGQEAYEQRAAEVFDWMDQHLRWGLS